MLRQKKTISLGKAQARSKFSAINGKSKARRKAYYQLKETLEYPDLCQAVEFIEKNIHEKRKELLYGKALPSNYSELGNLKEFPYLGEQLIPDINYCLVAIRKYSTEISLFLNYRVKFENSLLTGDYENAEKWLSKIENEICFSVWSLENRFVLKELSGKASENKEFLSHFNEINKSKSVTKSLAHYLSLRAEQALSVNRFNSDLEIALQNLKRTNKQPFIDYYRFRLSFLNHINFDSYSSILSLDFQNSIIDRYLNLVKVLSSFLIVSNQFEGKQIEKDIISKYLISRINYLIKKIDDPILYKLKLFSGDKFFPAFNIDESKKEIGIIDKYTSGLYEEVENDLNFLLLEKPCQFDLYLLYIKSLIYQNKYFIPIGNKKSIQNQILHDIYKITAIENDPKQAGLNLMRIANNLSSNVISYGIVDFVNFQTKGKEERKTLARLSYNIANPNIHSDFKDIADSNKFLNLLQESFPNSVTVNFFKARNGDLKELLRFENKIPQGKFKTEYAKKIQKEKRFLEASKVWEEVIQDFSDTIPIYENAIINLFKCYLELDEIDNCIKLYVNSFFKNNFIVEKVETEILLNKIRDNRFRNVSKNIDLPIFYSIVDADEVETHIAFELFNLNNEVEKPSQLISKQSKFDTKKFFYFLEHSCVSKVLMHSTFIANSKERLEERLAITHFIKSNFPNNDSINSEIKNIENILVIQQGLIDLDESKIYVNENGIIENELQEFKAIYKRFEIISGITSKRKFLLLHGGKLTTYTSEENTEVEKIEYSNNPVFDIYLELFSAVKDKFLNSQFGIVAYLSTRIRHGVLIGELRPIFEAHNLITLKEGNSSNYRVNYFWDLIYENYSSDKRRQLQFLLSNFSSKIDAIIFDLIKKHLQVFDEDLNKEGWFNYEFDDNQLWYHSIASSISASSYEVFVQGIFEILWERTDENLKIIRNKINNDILNQFNTCFNELERDLNQTFSISESHKILKAIKDCSTEIQTVVQKISRWFKRSEIKAADFKLSELIDVIAPYTSKSSRFKVLRLQKNLNYDFAIKGEYKTHFADLLRIFLENILKHSGENVVDIPCEILTEKYDNNLKISIENEITDPKSLELLSTVWNGETLDINKLLNEGKSGYHKAYKILTSDLRCDEKNSLQTKKSEDGKNFIVTLTIKTNEIRA